MERNNVISDQTLIYTDLDSLFATREIPIPKSLTEQNKVLEDTLLKVYDLIRKDDLKGLKKIIKPTEIEKPIIQKVLDEEARREYDYWLKQLERGKSGAEYKFKYNVGKLQANIFDKEFLETVYKGTEGRIKDVVVFERELDGYKAVEVAVKIEITKKSDSSYIERLALYSGRNDGGQLPIGTIGWLRFHVYSHNYTYSYGSESGGSRK